MLEGDSVQHAYERDVSKRDNRAMGQGGNHRDASGAH